MNNQTIDILLLVKSDISIIVAALELRIQSLHDRYLEALRLARYQSAIDIAKDLINTTTVLHMVTKLG